MPGFRWITENGFALVGAITALGGLLFAAISIREETHTRRISNLIALTEGHRNLWKLQIEDPRLERVLSPSANLDDTPVTATEERFVLLLILHLQTTFRAMNDKLLPRPEGVRSDVRSVFGLPIPREVWERYKGLQDKDFVRFIDSCRIGN